jgi:hypothetical protein
MSRADSPVVLLAIALGVSSLSMAGETLDPGFCIAAPETELADLINQYRIANNLPAVPVSTVLTTVGQWHARDATLNGDTIFAGACNLHSWSTMRPDLWTAGCYLPDHSNASLMWDKPGEISGGSYTATGFEIAYAGEADMQVALSAWQVSPAHNDVLLNQGTWSSFPWQAMGVGVEIEGESAYAYVWFATQADPSTPLSQCAIDPMLFEDRFEQLLP